MRRHELLACIAAPLMAATMRNPHATAEFARGNALDNAELLLRDAESRCAPTPAAPRHDSAREATALLSTQIAG